MKIRPPREKAAFLGLLVTVGWGYAPAESAPAALPAAKAASTAGAEAPCAACHGVHGEGVSAAHVPRIAGQSAEYLQKQLDNYADGTRSNPIMENFAKALSEVQRAQVASRYATMSAASATPASPITAATSARGHQLANQGDEPKRVQACNACHGPGGIGVLHAAPYLAAQSQEYLASALHAFKDGTRKNDAGEQMRSVAKQLDDADIGAVTAFYASLGSSNHTGGTP